MKWKRDYVGVPSGSRFHVVAQTWVAIATLIHFGKGLQLYCADARGYDEEFSSSYRRGILSLLEGSGGLRGWG